ncbi:MAG TPA: hypothetical protein VFK73_02655, partial [Paludibacter sp.]|nr:hypothetical protein [Paludibacter sp.]
MILRNFVFKTTYGLTLGLLLLLVSCDNLADSPFPNILFTKQASLPGNGRSSAVGFAINGKGYVALG